MVRRAIRDNTLCAEQRSFLRLKFRALGAWAHVRGAKVVAAAV
jgi:hypothetical protein